LAVVDEGDTMPVAAASIQNGGNQAIAYQTFSYYFASLDSVNTTIPVIFARCGGPDDPSSAATINAATAWRGSINRLLILISPQRKRQPSMLASSSGDRP
jgi:hypothetical protein